MKKIKLLILLLVFFIPGLVNADAGAPMIRPYKMVVTNSEGIDYYEAEYDSNTQEYNYKVIGHLNKDDTFDVTDEYEHYYIRITGDKYGVLKELTGTVLVVQELDPETATNKDGIFKYSTSRKAKIYKEEGVALQKGPAKVYETVTTIPKDTELTYQTYYDGGNGEMYIYVTYNGQKGWLSIEEDQVLIENPVQYIFMADADTSCGKIAKNTILTAEYKTIFSPNQITYLKYNGCSFYVPSYRSGYAINMNDQSIEKSNKSITIHEFADQNSKEIGTIPSGANFTEIASWYDYDKEQSIMYVDYNNTRGWIVTNDGDFEWVKNVENPKVYPNTDTNETPSIKPETPTRQAEEPQPKSTSKIPFLKDLSIQELVILCSGAAIIISLTAIVTVILVNKKNKKEVN